MINDNLKNFNEVILNFVRPDLLLDQCEIVLVENVFEDNFLIFSNSLVLNSNKNLEKRK